MVHEDDGEADAAVSDMPNAVEKDAIPPKGRPFDEWKGKPLTQEACIKVNRILTACGKQRDLRSLVALATSAGGLVDDEVRRVACMSMIRKPRLELC